jgi:hypothetical protein
MLLTSRRRFFQAGGAFAGLVAQHPAPGFAPQGHSSAADPDTRDLRQSQLFLDDTWIEETYRLERVWESADVYPEPVLRPEAPWEGHQIVMFGSVFRTGSEWRMYYFTYNRPEPSLCCLATSQDGFRWERPKLGLFEYRGNKANNIVFAPGTGEGNDGPTVCYDSADPQAPYKMMYYGFGKLARGEYVAFSKDGIQWDHKPGPVLITGDRTNVMGTRDHRGKFVSFLRNKNMMQMDRARSVSRSESDDFLHWTQPETILRQDLLDDPNTELYGMAGFPYSDLYLGMLERWYSVPDVFEIQIAWSYDGRDWHRPERRSAFIGPRFPWNKAWTTCANTPPIREENQLYIYFGGRSGAHQREAPQSYGVIGLASITVDRFAAIRADFKDGLLLTKPMRWPGGDLILNSMNTRYPQGHPANGGGAVSVEVRDEQNQAIPGFSAADTARFDYVSPGWEKGERPVRWGADRSLTELAGKRIRLAFTLRDAKLYSFRAKA